MYHFPKSEVFTLLDIPEDTAPALLPDALKPRKRHEQHLAAWIATQLSVCNGRACSVPLHQYFHRKHLPSLAFQVIDVSTTMDIVAQESSQALVRVMILPKMRWPCAYNASSATIPRESTYKSSSSMHMSGIGMQVPSSGTTTIGTPGPPPTRSRPCFQHLTSPLRRMAGPGSWTLRVRSTKAAPLCEHSPAGSYIPLFRQSLLLPRTHRALQSSIGDRGC